MRSLRNTLAVTSVLTSCTPLEEMVREHDTSSDKDISEEYHGRHTGPLHR